MGHLLLAACNRDAPAVQRLEGALRAARADEAEQRVSKLSVLDLDDGPTVGRVRAAIGLGWHARDRIRTVEVATQRDVDAALEVCLCGRHHLLGLGRSGIASVRWRPVQAERRTYLDVLAAQEGTEVVLDGGAIDTEGPSVIVQRLLAALEASRRPAAPVPGPDRGKA